MWLVFGEAGVQFGIQMIRRGGATVMGRRAGWCAGGIEGVPACLRARRWPGVAGSRSVEIGGIE